MPHSCGHCTSSFESRNALFRHLKKCIALQEVAAESQTSNTYCSVDVSIFLSLPENATKDVFLYATGGRVRGRTLGSVERFSFRRGIWEMCSYMNDNRGSHGVASVNENSSLYLLGGGGFKTNLATCEKLQCSGSAQVPTWKNIAPMKTYRHALVVVSFESTSKHPSRHYSPSIFAIGGWVDGSKCSGDVERYDVRTNSWHSCAPLLLPRRLLGATEFGDSEIYVFGGQVQDGAGGGGEWYTDKVERYCVISNSWSYLKPLPIAGPASSATVGNFMYIFVHGKAVFRYDPLKDDYIIMSTLPLSDWFCFDVCTRGPKVYLVGGKVDGVFSKAFWSYDTALDEWERLPDMHRQRRRCAVAIVEY